MTDFSGMFGYEKRVLIYNANDRALGEAVLGGDRVPLLLGEESFHVLQVFSYLFHTAVSSRLCHEITVSIFFHSTNQEVPSCCRIRTFPHAIETYSESKARKQPSKKHSTAQVGRLTGYLDCLT